MVDVRIKHGKKYYICSICGLVYESMEYARLCENYCSKHSGSCLREICEHAVGYLVRRGSNIEEMKFFKSDSSACF